MPFSLSANAIHELQACWCSEATVTRPPSIHYTIGKYDLATMTCTVTRHDKNSTQDIGNLPLRYYHLCRLLLYQHHTYTETFKALRKRFRYESVVSVIHAVALPRLSQMAFYLNNVLMRSFEETGQRRALLDAWASQLRLFGSHGPGEWGDEKNLSSWGDPLTYGELR